MRSGLVKAGLYDRDILEWSGRQADLLRRVARGERVISDDLDWPNIIEEVESVGAKPVDQRTLDRAIHAAVTALNRERMPDPLANPRIAA